MGVRQRELEEPSIVTVGKEIQETAGPGHWLPQGFPSTRPVTPLPPCRPRPVRFDGRRRSAAPDLHPEQSFSRGPVRHC